MTTPQYPPQWYKDNAPRRIPSGAHTYSKSRYQFPANAPFAIVRGKGARVEDVEGRHFIDWGMALSSVILGYAYPPITEVIKEAVDNGTSFICPSFIEAETAELICEQIPSAQMVKFAKNGSDATTGAIRLSRAYTQKEMILRCANSPFLSVNDWFIADTSLSNGTTACDQSLIKNFVYGDRQGFDEIVDRYDHKIACVILEPAIDQNPDIAFLSHLRAVCSKKNIVLIFDEIITGFRFHPKGLQFSTNILPDLSTFAKSIANGFSLSALVGKREIMQLGGLSEVSETQRVFLLSSTYGGETHHLQIARKNIEILNADNYAVTGHIYSVGDKIRAGFEALTQKYGLTKRAQIRGLSCRLYLHFYDDAGHSDGALATLFYQEMIKYGVLIQCINPSFSHTQREIDETIEAFDKALYTLSLAIAENRISAYLQSPIIKPIFPKS